MKHLIVSLPYHNVSPKGCDTYKSDGWCILTDDKSRLFLSDHIRLLEINENGQYFVNTTNGKRFTGDMDGNRFEITVTDSSISFKHIKATGAPLFKCHTRLDGLTLERKQ